MRYYYVVIVTDPSTHLSSPFYLHTYERASIFASQALKIGYNVCVEYREILTHFEDWGE